MAGRGGVVRVNKHKHWDHVVPAECHPDPSILRLNAHLHWEPAHEPLHVDIDTKKTCGVGPGMSFANAVKDRLDSVEKLGLVPCAVGGTAIKEWERGQHLYENMVKRAKAAVQSSSGGEIKAVLWYQGESDASSKYAESYRTNMETLIHDLRADLSLPNLPIIQVAIASGEDEKYIEIVREAQKGIDLPNVVCVDGKGLEVKEDNLHLTTAAQVKLGHMLADAYLTHFAAPPPSPAP